MFSKKKNIWLLALLLAVGCIFVYQFENGHKFNGNKIALAAYIQANNLDVEYIKVKNPNGYSEHWRDIINLQERSDTYDSYGKLVNRLLVLEKGKRVISIGNYNGKMEAYTWVLPDDIANENKILLSKSLLEDVKNKLKKSEWINKGKKKLVDGREVRVIQSSFEGLTEVFYVDATDFLVKREFFKNVNSQLILLEERTEEYMKISDNSGKLFKYYNTGLKEIPAPVGERIKGQY